MTGGGRWRRTIVRTYPLMEEREHPLYTKEGNLFRPERMFGHDT